MGNAIQSDLGECLILTMLPSELLVEILLHVSDLLARRHWVLTCTAFCIAHRTMRKERTPEAVCAHLQFTPWGALGNLSMDHYQEAQYTIASEYGPVEYGPVVIYSLDLEPVDNYRQRALAIHKYQFASICVIKERKYLLPFVILHPTGGVMFLKVGSMHIYTNQNWAHVGDQIPWRVAEFRFDVTYDRTKDTQSDLIYRTMSGALAAIEKEGGFIRRLSLLAFMGELRHLVEHFPMGMFESACEILNVAETQKTFEKNKVVYFDTVLEMGK